MYSMKRNRLFTTICLVAAALLTACTQDEWMEQGTTLPDGQYPLQIGGITLSTQLEQGEASPQTRVLENADGTSSVFENGNIIKVCIGNNYDNVGDYQLVVGDDGSITDITAVTPVYWTSTQAQTVHSWYTTGTDNTVSLADQSKGLAYVLQAIADNADYNTSVTFNFTHQLAKVQVKLTGRRSDAVTSVEVYGNTQCSHTNGDNVTGSNPDWIKMHRTTYDNGTTYVWEANLVPGTIQTNNNSLIRLNGSTTVAITGLSTLERGAMHTLTVTVDPYPDGTQQITSGTGNISSGNWYVTGNLNTPITITGGEPHIYLYNANVSVSSGNAISIQGGNPIIHVAGDNNSVSTGDGAGIYVAENATVTIQGSGIGDIIEVTGNTDGAAIGGYSSSSSTHNPCGDISINNVTVRARTNSTDVSYPGIGSRGGCGAIKIDNAVVYAYGTGSSIMSNPAIGSYSSVPAITITSSEIHAYRGGYINTSYADWIGTGGGLASPSGQTIQGDITSTIVHKGMWDCGSLNKIERKEGTVEYGADGMVQ